MDAPSIQRWFLRKHADGNIFGPLSFEQLFRWASAAQVSPQDLISTDRETWMKAPMLPQLGMDWLIEITSEHYYGPTTLDTVQEFIRLGEIDAETFVINSCDGMRRKIQDMPALLKPPTVPKSTERSNQSRLEPAASGIAIDFQGRIRDLEQSLREERRALQQAEQRYQELERKYQELQPKPTA